MGAAVALDWSYVEYFEPPPEKRVPLNFRVPVSLKEHLQAIVDLWKIKAQSAGHDPEGIDMTYVCERLLRVGVDGVWAQEGKIAGLDGAPRNDAEREALKRAILKEASKHKHGK